MSFAVISFVTCTVVFCKVGLRYFEKRQWWTLRLWLSLYIHGWTLLGLYLVLAAYTAWQIATWDLAIDVDHKTSSLLGSLARPVVVPLVGILNQQILRPLRILLAELAISSLILISVALLFAVYLPLIESRTYIVLRWKAWTGPGRTAITPSLVRYVGSRDDWQAISHQVQVTKAHPIESFLRLINPSTGNIIADPTDLLRAQARLDEESDSVWIPRSRERESVYAPMNSDQSVSLLWGRHTGFTPRCSRGIIAMPTYLLTSQPILEAGIDGRPVCLAHGILARNKGLEPHLLICGLQTPESRRAFEENSSLWPMPAKTLQSFYNTAMERSFHRLGKDYVAAATQLTLILADAKPVFVIDWLDAELEHQDLALNQHVAALGASDQDLARLYRGHYAAMLVGLSEHRVGTRLRPEILVYEALLAREGVGERSMWLNHPTIRDRRAQEVEIFGGRGQVLVNVVLQ